MAKTCCHMEIATHGHNLLPHGDRYTWPKLVATWKSLHMAKTFCHTEIATHGQNLLPDRSDCYVDPLRLVIDGKWRSHVTGDCWGMGILWLVIAWADRLLELAISWTCRSPQNSSCLDMKTVSDSTNCLDMQNVSEYQLFGHAECLRLPIAWTCRWCQTGNQLDMQIVSEYQLLGHADNLRVPIAWTCRWSQTGNHLDIRSPQLLSATH